MLKIIKESRMPKFAKEVASRQKQKRQQPQSLERLSFPLNGGKV